MTEVIVACEEISERKKAEERIRYLSFNDPLTGLYNRAFFQEELKRLDTPRQLPMSIIMGDLNSLKLINDAFGHHKGDAVLKAAADVLRASCRHEDIIARLGGDEFVVLLPMTSAEIAEEICNRIKNNCKRPSTVRACQSGLGNGYPNRHFQSMKISCVKRKIACTATSSSKTAVFAVLSSCRWSAPAEKSHETEEHTALTAIVNYDRPGHENERSELDALNLLAALHDIARSPFPAHSGQGR